MIKAVTCQLESCDDPLSMPQLKSPTEARQPTEANAISSQVKMPRRSLSGRAINSIRPWHPWSSTKGPLCEECLTIPPSLFTPSSSSAHWIYKGANAVERIHDSIQKGCP